MTDNLKKGDICLMIYNFCRNLMKRLSTALSINSKPTDIILKIGIILKCMIFLS